MIDWEIRGHVGLATINRPERRNALDAAHCDELRARLSGSHDLRAVVLTGAGSAFCAGADLGTRFAEDRGRTEHGDEFHAVLDRLLTAVTDHPAPVIAAVNGPALGAGTQLAGACDLRVAGPDAVFGIPAARLGIMVSASSVQRITLMVGHAHAAEMLLTGRRFDAPEALRMGLVHRTAADALSDALEWATEIAELAPLSVQGHKRALALLGSGGDLDDVRAEITRLVHAALDSADLREGLAAFAERRTPRFEGR